ncbi:hypothetical protein ACFQDQ_18130 [Haladaptatus sp. GCM10026878]
MVSQIVAKRVSGYDSADAVSERMLAAFDARRDEFDEIYGWD